MKHISRAMLILGILMAIPMLGGFAQSSGAEVQEITVLIRMMDVQDQWFRQVLIPKAEQELGVKITVATFDKEADIENMVKLEKDSGKKTIALVKTPQNEVNPMVKLGYVMPLEDIVEAATLKQDLAEYLESAVNFGVMDGKTYYIPRKLESNTFLYLKSQVAQAVANWATMQADIEAMFKKQNGYGLPAGYALEADPNV